MDDFEIELKVGFLEEATQGIADVEQCFLDLETNPNDLENINKIFRLAHNLKGSSKAVGFDQMGALTHEFETFILKIKNLELKPTPGVINLLLRTNDFVGKMIEGLKANLQATFDTGALIEELKTTTTEATEEVAEPAPETVGVQEIEVQEVIEAVVETPLVAIEAPVPTAEKVVPVEVPPTPAQKAEAPAAAAHAGAPEENIRVSVSKIEKLLNTIGEMVILQSVIREQAISSSALNLKKTLHQLSKVTKEVQEISMGLRMVPVKPTFQKMQRIVRDTAQALNKDVKFVIHGEETEVDKTVLEKINDPLVHLIRNSVDHGIEDGQTRAANGKPTTGKVNLGAYHKSGKLVIEVSDDGGGLNAAKLIKKAKEKGLLKPDAELAEADAYNLIFAPGFSTKELVTDVSGRGVGMDVVKTNILELGGEISIHSNLGKGTTFLITLPLTLAIIDGMVMTFDKERYVVPFSHVYETLRPQVKDIQTNIGLGHTLMLRGENIPIFRLGDFFGKKSASLAQDMIAVVIRNGNKAFAFLVDDILGQSQVVVKQLSPEMQGFVGVSGCTILGDGKPALILEPIDLVKRKLTAAPTKEHFFGGKAA